MSPAIPLEFQKHARRSIPDQIALPAGLQCLRRLWLDVREAGVWETPESGSTEDVGLEIGRMAHLLFPGGVLVQEKPWEHAPTSSVNPLACNASKRPSTEAGRRTAQALTGPPMPFRSFAPMSTSWKRLPRSFRVLSAITTTFGSATPCSRAARFGVSPTIPRSCASPYPIRSPTTTNPVAMPTRVRSGLAAFNSLTAAISSSPARTARSASSS
jgi:hypothetical protein